MPDSIKNNAHTSVHIVGAGLAGSEAAYFLAERGIKVTLYDMRPQTMTEAHKTDKCAELVCSNSLKSENPESAPGILKREMKALGSLVLKNAEASRVPGGEALTVDRDLFSARISELLGSHPLIERKSQIVTEPFADGITLFATGPLTHLKLTDWIARATGSKGLYFYDAIAPIVDASSLDRTKLFLANRYDKGGEQAYLNCPLDEQEYNDFINALKSAEKVSPKSFEEEIFFQGCQPIEAIAQTGFDSLRYGPMKPVGLADPETGKRPHAVVQLRPENDGLTAYNMVGFQTKLKYGEQARVFKLIPALKNATFLRMGSIHRNTYLRSPDVLRSDLSLKGFPKVYFAGQITGVEGYLESAASGILAGLFIYQRLKELPHAGPPTTSALGALHGYVTRSQLKDFPPNNMNFALFDARLFGLEPGAKSALLRSEILKTSDRDFTEWQKQLA